MTKDTLALIISGLALVVSTIFALRQDSYQRAAEKRERLREAERQEANIVVRMGHIEFNPQLIIRNVGPGIAKAVVAKMMLRENQKDPFGDNARATLPIAELRPRCEIGVGLLRGCGGPPWDVHLSWIDESGTQREVTQTVTRNG